MTAGWVDTTLGDVARIVSGATPKTGVAEYWDGNVPWATPKDLSELGGKHEISDTPRTISDAGLRSCAASVLPAGSVLLSSRAPIGHVAINTVPMATNQGFKSLVPDLHRVDSKFLYWWLCRNRPMLESLGNGATFKEISKKTTADVPISLPPLEEQRWIAAVLDAADALRVKRRQTLAKLDTLTKAIFVDMFGDPVWVASGPRAPISKVARVVTGNTPSRADSENYGDAIEWLKSDNILRSGLIESASERLSESGCRKGREAPPGASLVVCIAGSRQSIGRVGLLDRQAAFNQQINAVIPSEELLPEFLFQQLRVGQRLVQKASTNSMKGMVSKSALCEVEILVPPLTEQAQFVRAAKASSPAMEATRESSKSLDDLFASLQQRAFRGEL